MDISSLLASQFREVQLNGTWVATNLKTLLEDVTLEEAQIKIGSLNTISDLAFHINYYISGLTDAIHTEELTIKDRFSFEYLPFQSEEEWKSFLSKYWADAEKFAEIIEETNNDKLATFFFQEIYGTYFRNYQCMIEHSYYHLGQIVILKKLIRESHSLT